MIISACEYTKTAHCWSDPQLCRIRTFSDVSTTSADALVDLFTSRS